YEPVSGKIVGCGSPEAWDSRIRMVIASGAVRPREDSGKTLVTGSARRVSPSSSSCTTARAGKGLDTDASGTGASAGRSPHPPLAVTSPSSRTVYEIPGNPWVLRYSSTNDANSSSTLIAGAAVADGT